MNRLRFIGPLLANVMLASLFNAAVLTFFNPQLPGGKYWLDPGAFERSGAAGLFLGGLLVWAFALTVVLLPGALAGRFVLGCLKTAVRRVAASPVEGLGVPVPVDDKQANFDGYVQLYLYHM